MAYEKQEWLDKETVISGARMEHIEDGVETAQASAEAGQDAAEAAQVSADAVQSEVDGMPLVQSGSAYVLVTSNEISTATVTFDLPFSAPPNVTLTAESAVPDRIAGISVKDITATSCTVCLYRTTSTATSVHWIAVGPR